VDGVATIMHCASSKKGDVDATRNLVRAAASRSRPPHLVFVSIVGVDSLSWGYMRSKLGAERVVADSGLPWTTLRVTQFYDFVLDGAQKMAKLPVIPVPAGFRVQPIDPDEVAAKLVELPLAEPAGRVPDPGGPQVSTWADMMRVYWRARHRHRPIVPVWIPGTRQIRDGGLLVTQPQTELEHAAAHRTWEEFLSARLS
jgi:uncharacterized protein YbjT (DUF2867 family)